MSADPALYKSRAMAVCKDLPRQQGDATLLGGTGMNPRQPANLPASVHQRLLNLSQQRGQEFNRLLTLFAIERLLYRLTQSPFAGRFVLKGALLFMVWDLPNHRPTRDLDLLGFGENSAPTLAHIFQELCDQPVIADGLRFDAQSIQVSAIREEQEYIGQRIELVAYLGRARLPLQIDVGFGDSLSPTPVHTTYPALLEFPPPTLRVYAKDTVVAEKLHAMVEHDLGNSRMKDFYDLWTLSRLFAFDGAILTQAIAATFGQRHTPIPMDTPTALTAGFADHPFKLTQWQAFLRRNRLDVAGASFAQVIAHLNRFLLPPLQSLATAQLFRLHWQPPAGWQ